METESGGAAADGARVIAGGVKGDRHGEGGFELVARIRERGVLVVDLGDDVSPARFAGAIREHRPVAVVISCQLTVCAAAVAGVIDELERQGLRADTRILVGGAGLDEAFAREIGADGFAADSNAGVDLLCEWAAA